MVPLATQTDSQPDDAGVVVRHRVAGFSERWVIPEVPVPESALHERCVRLLMAILEHWLSNGNHAATVFANLAIRVSQENPAVGFDPDILLVAPPPADPEAVRSLRLWEPEHPSPVLAVEVVSPSHPYKDYTESPDQCAAVGIQELVVFDPLLVGPKANGGPQRIQLWRRTEAGAFDRVHAGEGPAQSGVLGGWWTATDEGRRLRLASDEAAQSLWPTPEEAERAARMAEHTARMAEQTARVAAHAQLTATQADRDAAFRRIAELEAELKKRG